MLVSVHRLYDPALGQTYDCNIYSSSFYYCHEVACYAYRIDHDISRFIECEGKVPEYVLKMYDTMKDDKEQLHAKWTPSKYVHIYHGLAGRNFDGARRLADLVISTNLFEQPLFGMPATGRISPFGCSLIYLLAGDPLMWAKYKALKKGKKGIEKAFAKIFEGLIDKDQQIAQEGLVDLVKALRRGEPVDDHVYWLNTWAIGMANLCRLHGVWVEGVKSYVPADLLIPQDEVKLVLEKYPQLGQLPPDIDNKFAPPPSLGDHNGDQPKDGKDYFNSPPL